MSPSSTVSPVAGIDVSSEMLDVALVSGSTKRFAYTPAGLVALLKWLQQRGVEKICCEATGGYEQPLARAAWDQGFVVCIVNPWCVRNFAHALNKAKTDRLEACVIARFAMATNPEPTEKPSENRDLLAALTTRRRQVTEMIVAERNRLSSTHSKPVRTRIEQSITRLETELQELEAEAQQLLQVAEFQHKATLLRSFKGVGPATTALLLAE